MFREAMLTDDEKWTKGGLFTMKRGYWHLQDKTKRSKMKKNTAIRLCRETSLDRMLEKCTGRYT